MTNPIGSTDTAPSGNAAALIALTAAAIATSGASLTAIGHLKDAAIYASLHGQPIGIGTLLGALRPLDLLFLALAAITVLALAALELRRRSLSRFLHTATSAQSFWLLTLLLAWTGHGYLFRGLQLGGDTSSHIVRFHEVAVGLAQGTLPDWTNDGYLGQPLLWFTGPLTYVVGGVLTLVLGNANLALKLLMFTTHVLAGWAMWDLLRRWRIRPMAAAIGAACFGGAFATLHLFFYRGETPQALTILFFVILFYAADGLMRGVGRRWLNFMVFALTTAALIVNHQPHAIFSAVYLTLFGAIAVALGVWCIRLAPALVGAGLLGVVTSLVAVLPVLFESDWVMIEPEGAVVGIHLPTPARLLHLVLWHDTLTTRGNEYWAYLGIGVLILAAAGLVGLARNRLRPPGYGIALPATACLVVSLFLANPVVRDVFFVLFFASILAALGLDWLIDRPVLAGRRLLALIGLLTIDLASTAIQPVARVDKGFLLAAGRSLAQTDPGERVLQVSLEPGGKLTADMGPDGNVISYTATVQRIAGNHNMAATRIHNFLATAIEHVQTDLQATGRLTPQTRATLGLFNVGRIICNSPIANGCPDSFADTATDPILGRYIPIAATPALFSQTLVTAALPDGLDKPMVWDNHFENPPYAERLARIDAALTSFVTLEAANLAQHTAQAIAVRQPGHDPAPQTPTGPLTIREYHVGLQQVTMSLDAPAAGFVQLAHPWFPSTEVTLNGAAITPIRGTIGLMVLPVRQGESVITLREGPTLARRVAIAASVIGLLAILAATAWIGRRRRVTPGVGMPAPPESAAA